MRKQVGAAEPLAGRGRESGQDDKSALRWPTRRGVTASVLARWLRARSAEEHVIHPASVAVSREHRRAKTDRLDTELLKRVNRPGFAGGSKP